MKVTVSFDIEAERLPALRDFLAGQAAASGTQAALPLVPPIQEPEMTYLRDRAYQVVLEEPGLTALEIATRLGRRQASVSSRLSELARLQLVTRRVIAPEGIYRHYPADATFRKRPRGRPPHSSNR